MLEIIMIILAVFIFVFLISAGWFISNYNWFVSNKKDIESQWSNIKTEYQRRIDLLLNLASAVKSYKKHERETLTQVISMRQGINQGSVGKQMKKMGQFDGLLSKLLMITENYPQLKASEQHNKLMDEVRITEERINVARTGYNEEVREFNVGVKSFPKNIVAGMFNFVEQPFYESEEGSSKALRLEI